MRAPSRQTRARNVPWIITSLADTDFYKLTMLQFIWYLFRGVFVTFRFKNRTNIKLAEHISLNELRRQLRHVSEKVVFGGKYIDLLQERYGWLFRDAFLNWLGELRLPMPHVDVDDDGNLIIEVRGLWCQVMLWETISMNIVNRLYFLERMKALGLSEEDVLASGQARLDEKIAFFLANPGLMFTDFGTRRRWSHAWQRAVLERIMERAPNCLSGTSNVMIGLELGLPLIGTMAHEMDMAFQGIFFEEDNEAGYMLSHDKLLHLWQDFYGGKLTIALSDTYGSEYFFDHFKDFAAAWDGVRHDSGDAFAFGEYVIRWYEKHGIDAKEKVLVFSDGLDHELMKRLWTTFKDRIKVAFGWGTKLTNDMGIEGLKALSIVMKLIWSNGHGTVKVSDNAAKTQGEKKDAERIFRLINFDLASQAFVACEV